MKKILINKRSARFIVLLIVSLLIIIITASISISLIRTNVDKGTNTQESYESLDSNESESTESAKTPTNLQESVDNNDDTTLTASITYKRQEYDLLKIGVNIDTITSSGECTLRLDNNKDHLEYSVEIQPLASSSTCKGFEVPIIELSTGTWEISITIESGDKSTTLTDSVVIE